MTDTLKGLRELVGKYWDEPNLIAVVTEDEQFLTLPALDQRYLLGLMEGVKEGAKLRRPRAPKPPARPPRPPRSVRVLQPDAQWRQHRGGGWVASTAEVSEDATIGHLAVVYGAAHVKDRAKVYGRARVYEHAVLSGCCHVHGDSHIRGSAQVQEAAKVLGPVIVEGTALVGGTRVLREGGPYASGEWFDP